MNRLDKLCYILIVIMFGIFLYLCLTQPPSIKKPPINHITDERIDKLYSFVSGQNFKIWGELQKQKTQNTSNIELIQQLQVQVKDLQKCKVTEEYVTVGKLKEELKGLEVLCQLLNLVTTNHCEVEDNKLTKEISSLKEQIKVLSEKEHSVVIKKEYTTYNCCRRHIRCN